MFISNFFHKKSPLENFKEQVESLKENIKITGKGVNQKINISDVNSKKKL